MKSNNNIVLAILSIILISISIPLTWFVVSFEEYHGIKSFVRTIKVAGTGGEILQIPIWLLSVVSSIGVALALMNFMRVTQIPRFIYIVLILLPLLLVLKFMIEGFSAEQNPVRLGAYVFIVGSVLGLIHTFIYKKDKG
ncbi:hypothetical protein GCM10009123_15360 [Kangiella japonica]|uniref:Uncharacterized protein n=1 Tax=Kangiella japonica TaxID=647384 RepID=A0ABN0T0V6_9GAMM